MTFCASMFERGDSVTIPDRAIRMRLKEQAYDLLVIYAAVAQHHGFHQRRPAEAVDMVERCACRDQPAHGFLLT